MHERLVKQRVRRAAVMLLDFSEQFRRPGILVVLEGLRHRVEVLRGFHETAPRTDHAGLGLHARAHAAEERVEIKLGVLAIRRLGVRRPRYAIGESEKSELPRGRFNPGKSAHGRLQS
jgi:hypothetical protein